MTDQEREHFVARVISGLIPIRLHHDGAERTYFLRRPEPLDNLLAEETWVDRKREAADDAVMTAAEALQTLRDQGLWDQQNDKDLAQLEKDTETLKVAVFQMFMRPNAREGARAKLLAARRGRLELLNRKHHLDSMTQEGLADAARTRFLVSRLLLRQDGTREWPNDTLLHEDSLLLDQAVRAYLQSRPAEAVFREVARREPWRSVWSARKSEGSVFGVPAAHLTEEQRTLCGWSSLYESVDGHPEKPVAAVIEDDDALDGWMIVQQRKQKEEVKPESLPLNEKIAGCGEVFLFAENEEEAKGIEGMNDPTAARVKAMRNAQIFKQGLVQEAEMPDSKVKILQQFAAMR